MKHPPPPSQLSQAGMTAASIAPMPEIPSLMAQQTNLLGELQQTLSELDRHLMAVSRQCPEPAPPDNLKEPQAATDLGNAIASSNREITSAIRFLRALQGRVAL